VRLHAMQDFVQNLAGTRSSLPRSEACVSEGGVDGGEGHERRITNEVSKWAELKATSSNHGFDLTPSPLLCWPTAAATAGGPCRALHLLIQFTERALSYREGK